MNDLYLLLRHLGIDQAHIGGLSMGGSVALNFGIAHPEMARSLIVASAGAGTTNREEFLAQGQALSDRLISEGMEAVANDYARTDIRLQLLRKDPQGWEGVSPIAGVPFRLGLGADLPGLCDESANHLRSRR